MMKVVIIEDESLAIERLENLLKSIAPEIRIEAKLTSIKDSIKWLTTNNVDLIFLDIQLSDGISFSIFEQININTPIIFTTAYDQYSIRAFQLNSVSYLLKPIRKNDLIESLQKYKDLKSAFSIDFEYLLSTIKGNSTEFRKRFLIQVGDKFKKIEIDNIAYFFALEKSVYIKTFEGKTYAIDNSIDSLEKSINPSLFYRINRKYLISINSISQMYNWSRSRIKLILNPIVETTEDTIVSINRTANFKKWLNK